MGGRGPAGGRRWRLEEVKHVAGDGVAQPAARVRGVQPTAASEEKELDEGRRVARRVAAVWVFAGGAGLAPAAGGHYIAHDGDDQRGAVSERICCGKIEVG
jgi:hypothetical protein